MYCIAKFDKQNILLDRGWESNTPPSHLKNDALASELYEAKLRTTVCYLSFCCYDESQRFNLLNEVLAQPSKINCHFINVVFCQS